MNRRRVFLTGGTGLLGHAVAAALLARGADLCLLARGTRKVSAQERVDRLMLELYPDVGAYAVDRPRIQVLEGDLCAPRFGLDEARWLELAASITDVVHCAALLNFLPEQREEVMQVNLEGARRVHELARCAKLETLHFVSTAYVVGRLPNPRVRPTEASLEVACDGQRVFNNPYEESKFLAEQLIAGFDAASGIRSTIYRPSCIIGAYKGGRTITFRTLYGFIDLIDQERLRLQRQGIANLQEKNLIYFADIPRDATRNVVPVDYVADAIAHIVQSPAHHGSIYHLTNSAPPNRWESNRWMTKAIGFGDLVMPSEATSFPEDRLVSFQAGRLGRFSRVFSGYLEDHEPLFDDANTRRSLAGSGIHLPPIDRAYMIRVVRYCLDTRWRNDVERDISARLRDAQALTSGPTKQSGDDAQVRAANTASRDQGLAVEAGVSSFDGGCNTPVIPGRLQADPRTLSLVDVLYRAAESAHGLLVVDGAKRTFMSYGELLTEALATAAGLQEHGLRSGDRVGIIQTAPGEFAISYFATLLAGGVPVPIYPPPSLSELSGFFEAAGHILQAARARFVLAARKLALLCGPLRQKCPEVSRVFDIDTVKLAPELCRPAAPGLDDLAMLQFTSGSTLAPRGVRLTHRCLAENIHVIRHVGVRLSDDDRAVSWLPLYHDMGLIGFLLTPMVQRITVALLPPVQFIMRPLDWLRLIHELQGTISFGPNFAYGYAAKRVRDADVAALDLSSWRVAGCGAEPIQRSTLDAFAHKLEPARFDPRAFTPCYGLAEFTLAASFAPLGRPLRIDRVDPLALADCGIAEPAGNGEGLELVSCGTTVPGHRLEIVDEHGQALPERRVGQIRLAGPSMSGGYDGHDDPAGPFRQGWLYTGDCGYIAEGELFVCGRERDIIKSRGRTYFPQDLEWAAARVDGIRQGCVAAFGVRDDGTEKVVIAAEHRDEVEASPALRSLVSRTVAESVGVLVDEVVLVRAGTLPKTSSGKIRRAFVQKGYLEGSLGDRRSGLVAAGVDLLSAQWHRLWSRGA